MITPKVNHQLTETALNLLTMLNARIDLMTKSTRYKISLLKHYLILIKPNNLLMHLTKF